jgi:Fe-S-cluster-containing dehydrogenase component/anaerobic selenocysteine-containing dehydrogenase
MPESHEFPPEALEPLEPPSEAEPVSRRRFLSLVAASAALAATSACEAAPADTIVPYTKKPTDVIPGVADYYASTYQEGLVPYGVLVKAREGRPIHIDGNNEHPVFKGKTSLRAQAEIIGLYDPDRLRRPLLAGEPASWKEADARVVDALKEAAPHGKGVLLLTPAVISPTRQAVIDDLKKALPGLEHVAWEPALGLTEREAAETLYGEGLAPRYRVDRARVIAGFEADFLGTMGNAVEAVSGFAQNRKLAKPGDPMSRLYCFESRMSITGSKADVRVPVRPSGAARLAFAVARALHDEHGIPLPAGLPLEALNPFGLDAVARTYGVDEALLGSLVDDLAGARGESLVLAGPSLPMEAHAAVALLNTMLDAEGHTVDAAFSPDVPTLATPARMADLTRAIASGTYAAVVFWQTNPSYAVPDAEAFNRALAGVPLKVSLGLRKDETARRCDVVLPINHWLESWNDYEPSTDLLSLQQPLIRPLYETRQAEEILLGWANALAARAEAETDYRTYLMARWKREVYPAGTLATFQQFWVAAVHDGVLRRDATPRPPRKLRTSAVTDAAGKVAGMDAASGPSGTVELLLEPDLRMWDGRYAEIGWLQELPDPITKVSWGNFLAVSVADAKKLGLSDGDLVSVAAGARSVTLPALVQRGQAQGTVFTVLGYGREGSVSGGRGANLFPLVADDGSEPFFRPGAGLSRASGSQALVRSQTEFTTHGRDIAPVWSLEEYAKNARPAKKDRSLPTLNPNLEWGDHKWGMAIDLSACIGCSACQIACQSENNIPVVGPEQVARGRIMHWIRSDVYYEGPADNPQVAHSLMLCQQCDDAPCEPVCPVAATVHSKDGLNEQVYNRCIGVRYCAANCPYMVRRFNFFDYTSFITDPLDLAFNPEVTVRPRGVMEKCTFCVQRIRNGVQIAKDEGRPVHDGDIVPACAVACPAEAIVFGDLKDPESRVSKLSRSDRGYKVLEDLGTRPAITYMTELRNPPEAPGKKSHV